MADAELRLKAVLDDDASRGIGDLEAKLRRSGDAAADANRKIGTAAATAARLQGQAAAQIGRAYDGIASKVKGASRVVGSGMNAALAANNGALGRFVDGFKSAGAAASSFSGKMGTLGGKTRSAFNAVGQAINGARGLASAAARKGTEVGTSFVNNVKSRVEKGKGELSNLWNGIGKAVAAGVGIAVGASVVTAIKNAAELEQTMGAMDAVFKEHSGTMIQWSLQAAESVGLSKVEYQGLATVLGSSLKNGGMALEDVGVKTNELITIGADLSSMFGGTTKEAVEAMTAALRGEMDPIERFGVGLSAAKVEAEAAALGFEKVGGELTTQSKQAAILSLISKQTADAQGNFARETTTLSGATQILKARWADVTTQWASNVVPMFASLVGWAANNVLPAMEGMSNGVGAFFNALRHGAEGDWGVLEGFDLKMQNIGIALHDAGVKFGELWGKAQPFLNWVGQNRDVFGTLALGIGIAATAMGALTAATWLLNAALAVAFSPVVIIGAFIGAVILAYNKIGWFKDFVNAQWETIKVGADAVGKAIVATWEWLSTTAPAIWGGITGTITGVIDGVRSAWSGITGFFSDLWNSITSTARVAWEGIKLVASAVATWFSTTGRALWDGAVRAIGAVMTWLLDTIVKPVWDGIRLAVAIVVGILMTLWDGIVALVRGPLATAFTWFRDSVITPVWNAIRTTVSNAWNFIRDNVLNPTISFVRGTFASAWNWLRDTLNTIWNAIRTTLSNAWNFIRDSVLQPTINFVRGAFASAWNWLRDTLNTIWTAIRNTLMNAWNFIRNSVLQPTINFIRGALASTWTWIRDHVSNIWNAIRTASSNAWNFVRNTVFQPTIDFIRGGLSSAWTWVRDHVTNMWRAVRDRLLGGWNGIKNDTFNPLTRFVRETIPNAFQSAKDAIGRVWSGIKSKIVDPINEAVRVIKNTLIGNINSVLRKFGMDEIQIGWTSVGGGFRDGGYTGPGHPGAPAGVVHRDEHVIKSPARRSIEHAAPGYLDALNQRGAAALGAAAPGAPVYAGYPSFVHGLANAVFSSGTLNVSGNAPGYDLLGAIRMVDNATKVKVRKGSGSPSVHVTSGPMPYWWAGYYENGGIRLNDSVAGNMSQASKRVLAAHEIGHALGLPHSDPSGKQSMMSYANMYQHNSVTAADVAALSAIYGGTGFASGGGGGIDIVGLVLKGIDKLLDGIKSRFTGAGVDMAIGGAKYLLDRAKTWITDTLSGKEPTEAAVGTKALYARRGAVLGGYGPGIDNVPAMLSRGESVLTPQLTRAIGGRNIEAANLAATGNRAGGIDKALGMLGGGSSSGGVTVQVNMDVTIEGNADMDALADFESRLEEKLTAVVARVTKRGY